MNESLSARIAAYHQINSQLTALSDEDINTVMQGARHLGKSIGGNTFLLTLNNQPIFVKNIKLTDLELKSENYNQTRNYYHLPLCYQYGIGSAGFGAWRELKAHTITTDWGLSEECVNFPLMYHHRVLQSSKSIKTDERLKQIANDVKFWQNSAAIETRLLSLVEATHEILVFLEFFPTTLYDWLTAQNTNSDTQPQLSYVDIESEIIQTIRFMKSKGFVHMDAHFRNILTNGKQLYFTDFGLALSTTFDLSNLENVFFQQHINYDYYCFASNMVHALFTGRYGKIDWIARLKHYLLETYSSIDSLGHMIHRYAPIALAMKDFYSKLPGGSTDTVLPNRELNKLLSLANSQIF